MGRALPLPLPDACNNRYGLQCLTNLDQLPAQGAIIFAAPLKIRNGSGSPLPVIALVPGQ